MADVRGCGNRTPTVKRGKVLYLDWKVRISGCGNRTRTGRGTVPVPL